MTRRPWTPEEDGRLIAIYHHWPASRVAAELGRSRNAVIGRAHRLERDGLMPAAAAKAKAARQPQSIKAKREAAAADEATRRANEAAARERAEAAALREQEDRKAVSSHTCRWPIGDPRSPDFRFCGAPAETSAPMKMRRPYCAEHGAKAVQPGTAWTPSRKDSLASFFGKRDRQGASDPVAMMAG